ncbi:MAG: hypothetical protein EA376_02935 [Phycisphaeraceae bacterium]|nr:MAG: hypothetical protein EA376_02935 [Phycisphaeraceae bacterium]
MPPEPPGWVKPVGILSIVFGSLGIIGSVCGLAVSGWMISPVWDDMMRQAAEASGDTYTPMPKPSIGSLMQQAALFAWAIVLLVAGIQTLMRKPVARALHLIWAVGKVVLVIWGTWIGLQYSAQMTEWAEQHGDPQATGMMGFGGVASTATTVLMIIWQLAWPTFCLIWFGLVKTKPDDITGGFEPAA